MLRYSQYSRNSRHAALPALALVSVIPIVLFANGCAKQPSEATVDRRNITAYIVAEGKVFAPASARADIYRPYPAPVDKVLVTEGQKVRAGETLMTLSAPSNQAYYEQSRTALQQAQRALEQARRQYGQELRSAQKQLAISRSVERKARAAASSGSQESSPDETTVSIAPDTTAHTANRQSNEQAVIDAQARLNEGLVPFQQAVDAAQQQFKAAQAGAKAAAVRTPIDGVVLVVNAIARAVVDPKDKRPLATVVNLEALKVAARIDEDQLSLLRPMNAATVTFKEVPNVEFSGHVDDIYSEKAGFLTGQKYIALVDFKNTDGQAKPEMQANAKIKIGEARDVLAVPANAIIRSDKQYSVKLRDGREWRQRIVEIGLSDGSYTEIKSGLQEGDVVMVNP